MDYTYIQNFNFNIYKSSSKFILSNINTIDGHINKYPKKEKISEYSVNLFGEKIGINKSNNSKLQFYTLRDMNALYRNTSFLEGPIPNGIDVTLENLYQYAWLFFLKMNFNPQKNKFLFGNLSPLYSNKLNDDLFKNQVVSYAFNNSEIVRKFFNENEIKALYGQITDQYNALFEELEILSNIFI